MIFLFWKNRLIFSQSYSAKTQIFSNCLVVNKAEKFHFFHFVTLQDFLSNSHLAQAKGSSYQE